MYPVGTKCVITGGTKSHLGLVVVVGQRSCMGPINYGTCRGRFPGLEMQQIVGDEEIGDYIGPQLEIYHPTSLMRPLEDPDIPEESILEIISSIKELADENNES